jgi:hypothetical protein
VSWEAVTALSTALTALVIAATVIVGYRQLRLTGSQIEHLRRATQLEGTLKIFDELDSAKLRDAWRFVLTELPMRMRDPIFRSEVSGVGLASEAKHKELYVLREFEKVGTYVNQGLIDGDLVYDYFLPPIMISWEVLDELGIVPRQREAMGEPKLWENFEKLYLGGRAWDIRNQGAQHVGDAAAARTKLRREWQSRLSKRKSKRRR